MKSTEILNKIKTFLGEETPNEEVKVELAQAKLENGTLVESESFKAGDEIFIITDDEKVAMPVGEYVMEDGKLLVVEEEGIIADYRVVSDDVPQKEDELEEKKEEMDEEAVVEDWAGMEKRIKNLEDAIADIKSKMGEKEDFEKVEEQVKQELSETPAAEPISHNPEMEDKKINLKYAQNRKQTSLDRVLSKMYNN